MFKTKIRENAVNQVAFPILLSLSMAHLLNDAIQSLVAAVYPIIKDSFGLTFFQIGIITFCFQLSSSLFQPLVGVYTDKKPLPFALAIGMVFSFFGVVLLSQAWSFHVVLVSVVLLGIGSSVFHPEASRMTFIASGGKRGFAQSVFQVGGNLGSALGPLIAALIVAPYGQGNILWFAIAAFLAIVILYNVGNWYKPKALRERVLRKQKVKIFVEKSSMPHTKVMWGIGILLILVFSKFFYTASITSYYTFYLMSKFGVSIQDSQVYLFVYLFAAAAGTLLGGPLGDKFGRKIVIWLSILGVVPFALALPFLSLFWTVVFSAFIGLILSSAFPAILVFAQELLPGKVGTISGLFFGFAFGMAGVGSAIFGQIADSQSIEYVFRICSFLPLLGLVALFLPKTS